MRAVIGFLLGVGITYLFGVFVGASFNPADWSWVWRLIVVSFCVVWGLTGAVIGHIKDEDVRMRGE